MLTLDFINVGYGDAILIRDGQFSALVDCGDVAVGSSCAWGRRMMAGDYLKWAGVDALDLLVLTHLHLDHSGGLRRVLDLGVRVDRLWTNYLPPRAHWGGRLDVDPAFSPGAKCLMASMNVYLDALARLAAAGTDIVEMGQSGLGIPLTPRLDAQVYLEEQALRERQSVIWGRVLQGEGDGGELDQLDGFINDTSIRLRLAYGPHAVELPGDVYARCWQKHRLSPCTVMKLPHHGHGDAVTPKLLDMLRPQYALISVSDDRRDDCPSARVIRALMDAGARVWVTDGVELPGAGRSYHRAVRVELTGGQCRVSAVDNFVQR